MIKQYVLLCLILLLAGILRCSFLGTIPPGVNRDEAAIGYTAFSLLETGRDEYGKNWPLSLESFGDWKLPGYVYADIVPLFFFSLSPWTVRIPSAFFGVVSVLFCYAVSLRVTSSWKIKGRAKIALLASFFLAISPWHIHFSRVGSEANMAGMLVLIGMYFYFSIPSIFSRIASSFFLVCSLYCYHGDHVFTPLLFIVLLMTLFFERTDIRFIIAFLLPFFIGSVLIFSLTLFSADKTKLSGLLPFSDPSEVYQSIIIPRKNYPPEDSIVARMMNNKAVFFFEHVSMGYINAFSPSFWFFSGGTNQQHNIPRFGNEYVITGVLFLLGIYAIYRFQFPYRWILLLWVLISPIPAALTKDAPHSARMFNMLPIPQILAGIGLWYVMRRRWTLSPYLLSLVIVVSALFFSDRYFVHMPLVNESVWGGGYPELVSSLHELSSQYSEIVMDRPSYSPYIYILFYDIYDPVRYQKKVLRYPVDAEGFHHVQQLENIHFRKIDWGKDMLTDRRLLVSWVESTPITATHDAVFIDQNQYNSMISRFGTTFGLSLGDTIVSRVKKTIYLKNGQPQFYLIEIKKIPQ